jgi:hypothetical protein
MMPRPGSAQIRRVPSIAAGRSAHALQAAAAPRLRGAPQLFLSESSVEKHVNAIFAKLDLVSEQQVHRRVAAVLTFLRDAGLRTPGIQDAQTAW